MSNILTLSVHPSSMTYCTFRCLHSPLMYLFSCWEKEAQHLIIHQCEKQQTGSESCSNEVQTPSRACSSALTFAGARAHFPLTIWWTINCFKSSLNNLLSRITWTFTLTLWRLLIFSSVCVNVFKSVCCQVWIGWKASYWIAERAVFLRLWQI